MAGRSPSTWLASSLLLLAGAGAEPLRFEGPPRLYAGRTAVRRIAGLPAGARAAWSLKAFSAEIAAGEATANAASELGIPVPACDRVVPAVLTVTREGGEVRVDVTLHPSRAEEVLRAAAGERVGLVGPPAGELPGLAPVPLDTPGAVRRFPGRLILLAPGEWDVSPFLPALLERARAGARILDLGADLAPWVDRAGAAPEGELARPRPLGPGEGNHRDLPGGLVREAFVGAGRMLLARLRVAEAAGEDPRAEEVLLDLVETALAPVPALRGVRAVAPGDEDLAALFPTDPDGDVTVLPAAAPEAERKAKAAAPALLVGPEAARFFDAGGREEAGPGLSERPAFLRFVTGLGIRVVAERPWR